MRSGRPYLAEQVASGDKFKFASFLAMIGFIGVIGLWIYSARGLVGRAGEFLGLKKSIQESNGLVLNQSTPTPILSNSGSFIIENDLTVEQIAKNVLAESMQTQTPYPTYTPYPTPTVMKGRSYDAIGIYSWYWPPLGGVNCSQHGDGSSKCSHVANGDLYTNWVDVGCACPVNLPFGTNIYIQELGISLICVDRGGLIFMDNDYSYWIDHLVDSPLLDYGTYINITITLPYGY